MLFVLDASITITWAMRDEDHSLSYLAFFHVQRDSAIVPGIWLYSVRNVLLMNQRRGRITLLKLALREQLPLSTLYKDLKEAAMASGVALLA